jgi:hypothetical protein
MGAVTWGFHITLHTYVLLNIIFLFTAAKLNMSYSNLEISVNPFMYFGF